MESIRKRMVKERLTMTKKQYLLNVTGFFTQMNERMQADCRPNIANHAKKQYEKYNRQLEELKCHEA